MGMLHQLIADLKCRSFKSFARAKVNNVSDSQSRQEDVLDSLTNLIWMPASMKGTGELHTEYEAE